MEGGVIRFEVAEKNGKKAAKVLLDFYGDDRRKASGLGLVYNNDSFGGDKAIKKFINESEINESTGKSLNALKAAVPGVKFTPMDAESLGDPEGYSSVEGYSFIISGVDEPATIVIYDGDSFGFWYDSAPFGTSLHSASEIRSMNQELSEVPKPLAKLNKSVFDSGVKNIKEYAE